MNNDCNESNQESLSCVKIEPKSAATHTVIWLHGLGADGHDFAPIVPELGLPADLAVRFLFPHAPIMPVTINQGYEMRAWYDIFGQSIAAKIDIDGIAKSVASIHQLIDIERKAGIPSHHILLAGFSQGALISLAAGLSYPHTLGGIIALSGYLPSNCMKLANEQQNTPIFLAHGTQDSVVPYVLGEATRDLLQQISHSLEWHAYPMAHSVCAEEILDIGKWMKAALK